MSGQICWLPQLENNEDLILHIRLEPHHPWKPYTHFPGFKVPDYPISGGSKGWATCQKLMKSGWTLISTTTEKRF